jgi:hypothetical protein
MPGALTHLGGVLPLQPFGQHSLKSVCCMFIFKASCVTPSSAVACVVYVACAGIGVPAAAASGMMAANSLVGVFDHLGVLNELAL